MEIFIYFILVIILIVIIGLLAALNNFSNNVKQLFADSDTINTQVFHPSQLAGLPIPVQQYFRHVLKEGQPYINYARLRHHGRFKSAVDGKWQSITGEEYFTVDKPGFIWKGKINRLTAVDSFIAGEGSLKVYLFSIFRIANGSGSKFSQGELLRWLGESVWFPTALLPNDQLHWEPINNYQAKLVYSYKKLLVFYIVTFNDAHEIIQMETQRYMGSNELETWTGNLSNYKLLNNVMIPATIQATWNLEQRDFTYAVFYLTRIDYNNPEKFKD